MVRTSLISSCVACHSSHSSFEVTHSLYPSPQIIFPRVPIARILGKRRNIRPEWHLVHKESRTGWKSLWSDRTIESWNFAGCWLNGSGASLRWPAAVSTVPHLARFVSIAVFKCDNVSQESLLPLDLSQLSRECLSSNHLSGYTMRRLLD